MAQATSDTSSIGPQWPPGISSYRRIKGIDNRGVIDSERQLDDLLTKLETLAAGLGPEADRLSVRALMSDGLLASARQRLRPWVEAVIPLGGCGERLDELAFVYLGRNLPSRASHPDDLQRSFDNVRLSQERRPAKAADMVARVRDGGYGLRLLGHEERRNDVDLRRAMAVLYERFGWNAEDTRQILANPDSLIAVALAPPGQISGDGARDEVGAADSMPKAGPQVVSAGIAELGRVRFQDGFELRFAEFTEAATLRGHQGRGLYSGIVTLLMGELAERSRQGQVSSGTLDFCFGECSGHDLGVLIAARSLGRRSSRQVGLAQGLPYPGYLPQHVPIAGAPRATPYNDLFPTFISRRRLYRFVDGEQLSE